MESYRALPKPLAEEFQSKLLREYANKKDNDIRTTLLLHNLRLVHAIAIRFVISDNPLRHLDDLFQEGSIGLLKAIETYDLEKGVFVSFAALNIKSAIYRYLTDRSSLVRLPDYKRAQLIDYIKVKEELNSTFEREPTEEELSKELSLSIGQIKELGFWRQGIKSLDEIVEGIEGVTIKDILQDENSSFEDSVINKVLGEQIIRYAQKNLSEIEFVVLILSFSEIEYTLSEIAQLIGKSLSRAEQLKKKALRKLRKIVFQGEAEHKKLLGLNKRL
ncbi:MAG: sigma-70 family RNA polymerase sigma factor [Gudongella sp.]|jgi:RNA polymerase sigma factor (sigma-70 family)|nr:sigma-70 family RNA polymerase sigma factor [Gudongella sp.]